MTIHTTTELLLEAWDPGFVVPILCVIALGGYGHRYRGRVSERGIWYALAVALFFVALASPIGVLAKGYLFSAHMLQHLLLVLAVPPLVWLGLPRDAQTSSPAPLSLKGAGGALSDRAQKDTPSPSREKGLGDEVCA